jgi:3-hydroxyacyl-[acyl-carrier-protein] dehydratase
MGVWDSTLTDAGIHSGVLGSGAAHDPLKQLPHGEPFRFVDQIIQYQAGVSGVGLWRVTGEEAFFTGHFMGNPIVPGVLIGEALAQMAGLVGRGGGSEPSVQHGMLAHLNLRFKHAVIPPADILLYAKRQRRLGVLDQYEVEAMLSERVLATGTLTLAYREPQ